MNPKTVWILLPVEITVIVKEAEVVSVSEPSREAIEKVVFSGLPQFDTDREALDWLEEKNRENQ